MVTALIFFVFEGPEMPNKMAIFYEPLNKGATWVCPRREEKKRRRRHWQKWQDYFPGHCISYRRDQGLRWHWDLINLHEGDQQQQKHNLRLREYFSLDSYGLSSAIRPNRTTIVSFQERKTALCPRNWNFLFRQECHACPLIMLWTAMVSLQIQPESHPRQHMNRS